jgi:exonuclease VII small subunit
MNNENNDDSDQDPKTTTTYASAYADLFDCAEKLKRTGPADIDDLIADYRRAMAAYRICAHRLD